MNRAYRFGAGGHRSMVRRSIDQEHPDARYAGYAILTGKAPCDAAPGWQEGHNYMNMITLPNQDGAMSVGDTQINGEPRRYFWQWVRPPQSTTIYVKPTRSSAASPNVPGSTRTLQSQNTKASIAAPRTGRHRGMTLSATAYGDKASLPPDRQVCPPTPDTGAGSPSALRAARIEDAAYVPSPMTGAGFDTGLKDAYGPGELTSQGMIGGRGTKAFRACEKQRLRTAQSEVCRGCGALVSFFLDRRQRDAAVIWS